MKILGINCRNLDFIMRYNRRALYPRADNKLLTKSLAAAEGIAVPQLLRVVEVTGEIEGAVREMHQQQQFVLKPARGSGGDGILVFEAAEGEKFRRHSGSFMTATELRMHIANVLHGMYSLGGLSDQAFFEERVQFSSLFESLNVAGTPDVRVIVFLGVPVMAMLRLPTMKSGGRANLHQGAIGVGVDIRSGCTTHAFGSGALITEHPDSGEPTAGFALPDWDRVLHFAARAYDFSGLGYLGVDVVYDRLRGPMLLEINARPGLSVQMANRAGLLPRLRFVEKTRPEQWPAEKRLALLDHEVFRNGAGVATQPKSASN